VLLGSTCRFGVRSGSFVASISWPMPKQGKSYGQRSLGLHKVERKHLGIATREPPGYHHDKFQGRSLSVPLTWADLGVGSQQANKAREPPAEASGWLFPSSRCVPHSCASSQLEHRSALLVLSFSTTTRLILSAHDGSFDFTGGCGRPGLRLERRGPQPAPATAPRRSRDHGSGGHQLRGG
jgi:hypothetical protein